MLDCPNCETKLKRGRCPECGWSSGGAKKADTNCVRCHQREQARSGGVLLYRGLCVECGRCHGGTDKGRCTFRSEAYPEARRFGYCGWHERVVASPHANTFEEFEWWCDALTVAKVCDRWTHFTPLMLWNGMEGRRGHEKATRCSNGECPHAPGWTAPSPPLPAPAQTVIHL